jgi:hypothetical protein
VALTYVETIGQREGQWDLARIQRNPTKLDAAYAAAAALSPTAVTPACWALDGINTQPPYCFRLSFSTDTAIAWKLYYASSNAAIAQITGRALGACNGSGIAKARAQVVAAPAVVALLDGGFAAANSWVSILNENWLKLQPNTSLVLATSLVAANCFAAFWWCEYND